MKSLFLAVALVSISLVSKVNAFSCWISYGSYLPAYEDARAVSIGDV